MSAWNTAAATPPASQQLARLVRALGRAHHRQQFVAWLWPWLFWSLLAACAAFAWLRLGGALPGLTPPPGASAWGSLEHGWRLAGLAGLVAFAGALACTWWRAPDDLQVAILADLQLRLQQRLSTAWELLRGGADAALSERLAARVFGGRRPPRVEQVFRPGLNTWARLLPLVAALMVLVASLDLSRAAVESGPLAGADAQVVAEGERLRAEGWRMRAEARQRQLAASASAAEALEGLGREMRAGGLGRPEALARLGALGNRLDEARLAALEEGRQTPVGPLRVRPVPGAAALQPGDVRELLRRLLEGDGDAEGLREQAGRLAHLGIDGQSLRQALDELAAGDEERLRDLHERLAALDQARQDAELLGEGREAVRRAREGLGGAEATPGGADADGEGAGEGSADALAGRSDRAPADAGDDGAGLAGEPAGGTPGPGSAEQRARSAPSLPPGADGAVLRPEAQPRAGEVFRAEARVLPRSGTPRVAEATVDVRHQRQLEAALAREDYPWHRKEYLRRYFLGLGAGLDGDAAGSDGRE